MTGYESKRAAAQDKLITGEEHMKDEALKLALEALENHCGNYKLDDAGCERWNKAVVAINDALAQPAQEPVAWITPDKEGFRIRFSPPTNEVPLGWDALYTTPPQPAHDAVALRREYQSGYYDGKKAALAGREWNFCERCGKRTADLTVIHTCTPPHA
jgi:hypothetical protein